MDPIELRKQAAAKIEQAKALQSMLDADDADFTDEQRAKQEAKIDGLIEDAKKTRQQADDEDKRQQAAEQRRSTLDELAAPKPLPRAVAPPIPGEMPKQEASPKTIPASVKRYGSLRNMKDDLQAYSFGQWCLAGLGNQNANKWCETNGLPLRNAAHVTNDNSLGGFLVPDQFENDLIDLREQFGVFRREAKIRPMSSDTRSDPRRTGGLTANFVGELTAIPKSNKSWDRVQLTARKLAVLSIYSSELAEDAVVNIGDDLAGEIAYAFSLKEDQCGFNGDGTSTYGGIHGIIPKLEAGTTLDGHVQAASGNDTAEEYTLADFVKVMGSLPQYADANAKWYVSRYMWAGAMSRLQWAAGGNAVGDIAGPSRATFLGYPVVISQVMIGSGDHSGKVAALFGDLPKAASFGDRRGIGIAFSTEGTVDGVNLYEVDGVGVRGTERFDINVHDLGTTTEAGPVVALIGN